MSVLLYSQRQMRVFLAKPGKPLLPALHILTCKHLFHNLPFPFLTTSTVIFSRTASHLYSYPTTLHTRLHSTFTQLCPTRTASFRKTSHLCPHLSLTWQRSRRSSAVACPSHASSRATLFSPLCLTSRQFPVRFLCKLL